MSFISYLINGISLGEYLCNYRTWLYDGVWNCKNVELAHGDVIMIGCYVVFTMMSGMGMPALPSVIADDSNLYGIRCRD